MSKLSVCLLPCGNQTQHAVTLLQRLQGRANATLSFVSTPVPARVELATGIGEGPAAVDRLCKTLRSLAKNAPGSLTLLLGDIEWRPYNGQLELCVQVQVSPEFDALQAGCHDAFTGLRFDGKENSNTEVAQLLVSSATVARLVLGTTHSRAAHGVKQRLESWWRDVNTTQWPAGRAEQLFRSLRLASSYPESVDYDALAVVAADGTQVCRVALGRDAAVQRGLSELSGMPCAPPVPKLYRAHSHTASPAKGNVAHIELGVPLREGLRRSASFGVLRDADSSEPASAGRPLARARSVQLDTRTWAVGLTLASDHPALMNRPPTRFHFVLDNSGSMGRNTEEARTCFSQLVSVANGPCSLTVFSQTAETLGESFVSPASMCAVALPRQGQTNITDGVARAVDIIRRCEQAEAGAGHTHHVVVLLSDGQHNKGPAPETHLPQMGDALRKAVPSVRLSAVVVGVTRSSSTSLGMLFKQSLETVALPSLEPVYFAHTPRDMTEVLGQMSKGLAAIRGGLIRVSAVENRDCPVDGAQERKSNVGFVSVVGQPVQSYVNLAAKDSEYSLLCTGSAPPSALLVDGVFVRCLSPDSVDFDSELAADALQELMDGVRLRRVAGNADTVRPALQQLHAWTKAMEERLAEQRCKCGEFGGIRLVKAGPSSRVAQHKAAVRALHGARELQNQLAEIEALRTNDSASQAAFLTGARQKYGAKALRRANAARGSDAVGDAPGDQLQGLLADVEQLAAKMRHALRADFCAKLSVLSKDQRAELRKRLGAELPPRVPRRTIDMLCFGSCGDAATTQDVASDSELAELVDGGAVARPLWEVAGDATRSYLSMQTAWEQLNEWCTAATDAAKVCRTEYELLMYLGALGLPIDVKRRAATQMNPFAMEVTRVRAAPLDTASLCCALRSDMPVVPPEGGLAVEDALVLVDPEVPRASRLAAFSKLLGEVYTSVVLCRDLHMYTGRSMRVALHAHSFLAASQPARPKVTKSDLEAQLRRQLLGRAYQCPDCGFGPVDHHSCADLSAHGESDGEGAVVNNACPECGFFSEFLGDWPAWDGTVPDTAIADNGGAAEATACSAAMVAVSLRLCYSARATWRPDAEGDAHELCKKLAQLSEPLTAADGVDHPVQLLLALAICDEVQDASLDTPAVIALLNEVCARKARDELRATAGTDENAVTLAGRRRVADFLGITSASAPEAAAVDEAEPPQAEVRAGCDTSYTLNTSVFDYSAWVCEAIQPFVGALVFVQRLRHALNERPGGWPKLARDLEVGPGAYEDVLLALQAPLGDDGSLAKCLEVDDKELPRIYATMAAQAFLHHSSQLRRLKDVGGSLSEPLGQVCAEETLQGMAVDVRMATYLERVAAKMQEWRRVGTDITITRARACDIGQYAAMCGSHVHGLSKEAFWGLWRAAKRDGHNGQKVREFLQRANQGFNDKHAPQ